MNVVHCKFWLHVSPTAGEGSKRKTRVTHGHKSCCKSSAAHSGNSGLLHCIEQVINAVLTCSAVWGLGLQLSEFGGILHLRPPLLANGAFELICLNTSWYFMVEGAKASLQESNHAKWLLQSTDAMHWMRHTHTALSFFNTSWSPNSYTGKEKQTPLAFDFPVHVATAFADRLYNWQLGNNKQQLAFIASAV